MSALFPHAAPPQQAPRRGTTTLTFTPSPMPTPNPWDIDDDLTEEES